MEASVIEKEKLQAAKRQRETERERENKEHFALHSMQDIR